jgi:putative transposase
MYLLRELEEVRTITEDWINECNTERTHQSLGLMTPVKYRQKMNPEESNFLWP